MLEKLTFLFAPLEGAGHMYACIGLAERLRERGHKVVFAVPNGWKGKLAAQGFHEEWFSSFEEGAVEETICEIITKVEAALECSAIEQIERFLLPIIYVDCGRRNKISEPKYKEIVNKVKPDVIIVDNHLCQPALMSSGIPWILSFSVAPLAISNKNVPPAWSGYPIEGNKDEWTKFESTWENTLKDWYADFKNWTIENGGPALDCTGPTYLKYSPYANIYMYPEELDYIQFRPNPPNFHQFDAYVRSSKENFELPEKLRNATGKLVYFSMGTIGCSLLKMMRRLISILGKSPHRFIVSKGPFANELELADNMWGMPSVPQPEIIPLVDLVICHGGNNTVTESFCFGKPLIVLPLFADQFDNAQRIYETGLGLRFDPYKVTEIELLTAIDKLLSDDILSTRMTTISNRIQSSNSQSRAADLIEDIGRNNRKRET